MRYLFLLTQDLHSPSGLGRYLPLAAALVRQGHTVTIAALHPDYENLEQREQIVDGVLVRYVAPMHVKKRGSTKQYYSIPRLVLITAGAAWRLFRAAFSTPSDVIYICKPHPMNSLAGWAARILRPSRKVYLDVDDYEAASNRFSGGWQRRIVIFFEDRVPFLAQRVSSNTYFSMDRMRALGLSPKKLVYLPNGVDRARFSAPPVEEPDALRARLGLAGKQVIVYVGSLSLPSHPVDLLLEAFALLALRLPEARLLIVGGGEDLHMLKEQALTLGIVAQVIFTGRVAPQAVPDYFRLGDVSVDPVYDTPAACGRSPLKMFESWAAGTAFITIDVGDRRRIAGDPPAALLARPGSPNKLAEAIEQVLTQPELRRSLVQAGQQRIQSYYWDAIVESASWLAE